MPYSRAVKISIAQGRKSLGNQLGRWAVSLDLPVTKLALATGATRQTLYNWFSGGEVTNAYRERVETVLTILKASATAEVAWRKMCKRFDLIA